MTVNKKKVKLTVGDQLFIGWLNLEDFRYCRTGTIQYVIQQAFLIYISDRNFDF